MNASTETPMVSAASTHEGEGGGSPARRRRWWPWWLAGAMLLALAGVVLAAFTIRIPYYEFRPGSVRPVASLVEVEGVETYPPSGDIGFTTVSLSQSTLASYVLASFDDDIDVVDEDVVLGPRSPDENRQFNLRLMDTSKQDAARAALIALGYEVPVTIDGFVVTEVEEGSAADGVIDVADAIVSIDGQTLDDVDDLESALAGKGPGTEIRLGVEPAGGGEVSTVDLVLGTDPSDPDQGLIGVRLRPREPQYEYPFEIQIDSGSVGGPSAGLAFALAVIDVLTPGELTGGHRVAVTGTIDGAGNVGPVGGEKQKTAVVIDEGYEVFIVPDDEVNEVSARAGDDLRVIGVDTLSEALDALESLGGSGIGPVSG